MQGVLFSVSKIRNAIYRFMYGRNGVDALSWALLIVEVVLSLLGSLFGGVVSSITYFLSMVLAFIVMMRIFSRNVGARRAENARFLAWCGPLANDIRGAKARRADTAHKYARCSCGAWCRVPRGVGRVELTCPKCGRKKVIKA